MKYLLDTNIISEIMNNPRNKSKVTGIYQKKLIRGDDIYINGITYYEIKRGLLYRKAKRKIKAFEIICSILELIFLEKKEVFDAAAEIYIELKRKGKFKKDNDADILIAATALVDDLTLVTDNEKDFMYINKLKWENWKK